MLDSDYTGEIAIFTDSKIKSEFCHPVYTAETVLG